MALVEYSVEVSRAGWGTLGEVEVPDAELAGKTDQERQAVITGYVQAEVENIVQWGWQEVSPDGA
jgi:hypothetical protein